MAEKIIATRVRNGYALPR